MGFSERLFGPASNPDGSQPPDTRRDMCVRTRGPRVVFARLGCAAALLSACLLGCEKGDQKTDAEAYLRRGIAHGEKGEYGAEIASYRMAIDLRPDYAEAYYNMSIAHGKLGQHAEALAACRKAVAIRPDFAEAHYNVGVALHRLGQPTKAIASCERASALKPDLAWAHVTMGNAYSDLGQVEKAIEYNEQALAISRENGNRHGEGERLCNLGSAYGALGQLEKAAASTVAQDSGPHGRGGR